MATTRARYYIYIYIGAAILPYTVISGALVDRVLINSPQKHRATTQLYRAFRILVNRGVVNDLRRAPGQYIYIFIDRHISSSGTIGYGYTSCLECRTRNDLIIIAQVANADLDARCTTPLSVVVSVSRLLAIRRLRE